MEVSGQTRMVSTCASLRCMVLHQLPNLAKTTLTWLWACPTLTSSDSDTLHHGMVSDFADFILIHLICPCALVGNQSKAIKQIDPEGGRVDGGPNDQSMQSNVSQSSAASIIVPGEKAFEQLNQHMKNHAQQHQ